MPNEQAELMCVDSVGNLLILETRHRFLGESERVQGTDGRCR